MSSKIRFEGMILLLGLALAAPGCGKKEEKKSQDEATKAPDKGMEADRPQPKGMEPDMPQPKGLKATADATAAKPAAAASALEPIPDDQNFVAEVKKTQDILFCESGGKKDLACQALEAAIAKYRTDIQKPMRDWLATRQPADLPATVLYPFAGGDLVTELTVFPKARTYVNISLEHSGPPDPLSKLPEKGQLAGKLQFMKAAKNFLTYGENFSVVLQKQEASKLPGMLPMFLMGLRIHGGEVTAVRYFAVSPDGTLKYHTKADVAKKAPKARAKGQGWKNPQFSARFSNVEIRFKLPGDAQERVLRHLAANLSNVGLKKLPGMEPMLKALGPRALQIKASSYLLWTNDFTAIREWAFDQASDFISDISAPFPEWLKGKGWTVELFGKYRCAVNQNLVGFSLPWRKAFQGKTEPVPFRYGYRDCDQANSLIIGKRK
jgi:hypothetical protein